MKDTYSIKNLLLLLFVTWTALIVAFWPIMDAYKATDHLWISCHTIQIVTHWIDGSPFSTYFALLHLPASIETPTLESQAIYSSYPPGFALPVWGLSLLFSFRPDIFIVRLWNLFLQLSISISIAYFAWNSLQNFGKKIAFFASLFASFFYLLSRTSLLFHYSAYFSDQFVLLPIIVLFCYEIVEKKTLFIRIFTIILVFFGGLSDPFIYFTGGIIFIYKIFFCAKNQTFLKRVLSTTHITAPLFLAFCMYVYQIVSLGQVDAVINKFFIRTSDHYNNVNFSFLTVLLHYKMDKAVILVPLFVISTFIKLCSDKKIISLIKNTNLVIVLAISIITHTLFFLNHSAIHNFSIMKYQILLSIIMGICLACLLYKNKSKYISSIIIFATVFLLYNAINSIVKIYSTNEITNIELASIIKNNHNYEDIFISPEFEISALPPQLSSISDKQLYLYKDNDPNSILKDFGQYFGKANFHYVISDKYLTEDQIAAVRRTYHDISVNRFNNVNMPNIFILNLGKQTNPSEFLGFVRAITLSDCANQ